MFTVPPATNTPVKPPEIWAPSTILRVSPALTVIGPVGAPLIVPPSAWAGAALPPPSSSASTGATQHHPAPRRTGSAGLRRGPRAPLVSAGSAPGRDGAVGEREHS